MTSALDTITKLEMAGGGLIVLVGIGVGAYFWWTMKDKTVPDLTDDASKFLEKVIGDPAAKGIQKATGGAFNFKLRTMGTLGSAQDLYETQKKLDETPGAKTLITIQSLDPRAALLTGVGQLIKQGKDKKLAVNLGAKGDTDSLKKQLLDTQEAITSKDPAKVDAIKVTSVSQIASLMKQDQIDEIKSQVAKFVDNHDFLKPASWTDAKRKELERLLVIQKQIKYLVNRGVFVKKEWVDISYLNQQMFARAAAKITNPKAIILIDKKKVDIVKNFISTV